MALWAKDGEKYLEDVLGRIDSVIPREGVDQKIFVDDHSTDSSRKIAQAHNWTVYPNIKGGVGEAANIALSLVGTEFFASFEQDLLLARDWYPRISRIFGDSSVAVAQGWRRPDDSVIAKIEDHVLQNAVLHSSDNNIYNTDVIRKVGGFPRFRYQGVDGYLRSKVLEAGYKWVTDANVMSVHLRREGLKGEIRRNYTIGRTEPRELLKHAKIAILSPCAALEIVIKKKCPQAAVYYPLMRYARLKGQLKR